MVDNNIGKSTKPPSDPPQPVNDANTDRSKQGPLKILLKRKHSTLNEGKQGSSLVEKAPMTHVPSSIAVHPRSDYRPGDELSMLGCDDATEPPASLSIIKNPKDTKISVGGKSDESELNLSKMGCEEATELPSSITGKSLGIDNTGVGNEEVLQTKLAGKISSDENQKEDDTNTCGENRNVLNPDSIENISVDGSKREDGSSSTIMEKSCDGGENVPQLAATEKVIENDGNDLDKVKL